MVRFSIEARSHRSAPVAEVGVILPIGLGADHSRAPSRAVVSDRPDILALQEKGKGLLVNGTCLFRACLGKC